MEHWDRFLAQEMALPYYKTLMKRLEKARENSVVLPPEEDVFSPLRLCPLHKVKVVILGQDPYHGVGQSHGLCFSVRKGVKIPPSLRNIFKELQSDLGVVPPADGYLEKWATQGVLMINSTWTVEAGKAGSHQKFGWQTFTAHLLELLNQRTQPIVFILWGNHAKETAKVITNPIHLQLTSSHPSPLVRNGDFFGSKPFSKANAFLHAHGLTPIDWELGGCGHTPPSKQW